jgi:sulfonate transport system substrate-binding protein
MSRMSVRWAGAAALLVSAVVLTACSGGGSDAAAPLSHFTTPAAKDAKIAAWRNYTFTIGDNGGDGSEPLAQLTGVFRSAPYKVKFAHFTYGPPLVQATASGDIDLGVVGDVPPITGAAKEYGFSIVGVAHPFDAATPNEDILVQKGSPLTSLSQLRGKKIAVPQGSSAHGLALQAIKSVGLTPQDVHFVFLSPAAGASAFASGSVDAWAIWNPQAALAVKAGARVLAKGLPPIDQVNSYYVAPTKDLTDPSRRAALTDMLERLSAVYVWGTRHPDTLAKAVAADDGIPLADAKSVLIFVEFHVTPVMPADITAEQNLATAFQEAGQITKQVNVAQITTNILPAGFDSNNLTLDSA